MLRAILTIGMIAFFQVLFSRPSFASCSRLPFEEAFGESTLVFSGQATVTEYSTKEMVEDYSMKYNVALDNRHEQLPDTYTEFVIDTQYKGPTQKNVRVYYNTLPPRSASSGALPIPYAGDKPPAAYKSGDKTIIFANYKNGIYIIYRGACSYTDKAVPELDVIKKSYDELDVLIAKYPTKTEFLIKKAQLQEKHKDYGNAVRSYESVFNVEIKDHDNSRYKIAYGRNLYYAGVYDQAIKELQAYATDDTAATYIQLAKMRQGRFEDLANQKLLMAGQEISDLIIRDVSFDGADFTNATLKKVTFLNVKIPKADFSQAKFEGEITKSDFNNAKFEGSKIWGMFEESNFSKANFSNATIHLNRGSGNSFQEANFASSKASILECVPRPDEWKSNDFSGAHFTNATIGGLGNSKVTNADFSGMKFFTGSCVSPNQGLDLSGRVLNDTKFDLGDYSEGSFKGASLKNSTFIGDNLMNVDFRDADLTGADFSVSEYSGPVKLNGADFTGARLEGVNWEGAIYDCKTKFPDGFDPFINRLEAADPACRKAKGDGLILYSRDRFKSGRINVCYGDFNAGCVYAFLINYTINGTHTGNRFHYFRTVIQSLINAGQYEPARLMLMRELAEFEQINGVGVPIIPELKALIANFQNHTLSNENPMPRKNSADANRNPVLKTRNIVLEMLASGDEMKARQMVLKQITDVHHVQNSIGAEGQAEILMAYVDILGRTEKISPEVPAELEQLIRTSHDIGGYKRAQNIPAVSDYVLRGEKIYSELVIP